MSAIGTIELMRVIEAKAKLYRSDILEIYNTLESNSILWIDLTKISSASIVSSSDVKKIREFIVLASLIGIGKGDDGYYFVHSTGDSKGIGYYSFGIMVANSGWTPDSENIVQLEGLPEIDERGFGVVFLYSSDRIYVYRSLAPKGGFAP